MLVQMTKTFGGLLATLALLFASEAHAQFANRSLGAGVGFVKLFGGSNTAGQIGIDFAVPFTLEGSLYIENGFDLFLRAMFIIVQVSSGAETLSGAGLVYGGGGHLGARYLFMEETLRPYVGLEIAGFAINTVPVAAYSVGPGVTAGLDYFVADTVAIGINLTFDLFIQLNVPPRPALGGGLNVAFYF